MTDSEITVDDPPGFYLTVKDAQRLAKCPEPTCRRRKGDICRGAPDGQASRMENDRAVIWTHSARAATLEAAA